MSYFRVIITVFCFMIACPGVQIHAQEVAGRDLDAERLIVAELEELAPAVVPEFVAATEALDRGENETAAEGYQTVLEAAPDFDPALRRLGWALRETGNYNEGIKKMERALQIHRSAPNLFSLALNLVRRPENMGEPSRGVSRRAYALAKEAAELKSEDAEYLILQTQIALKLEMDYEFRKVAKVLLVRHPENVSSQYYGAVSAAMNGDKELAEERIRAAGRLGLDQWMVDSFVTEVVNHEEPVLYWAKIAGYATGIWAGGLLLLFILGRILSSITMTSVERDDPNQPVTGATRKLRGLYRWVVSIAGVYWYISLPFVALIVVVLTGSVLYGFLMVGRIPIKLAIIIIIGAIVTVFAIVRSLFIRTSDADPGRAITQTDAPGLWDLAREVAAEVDTRPVDEIWLTPGTELAVYERGGWKARFKDRARRALIVGAGVLDDFDQNALRAVLAHEYGHFSHRDTAGGDIALRVRNGMHLFGMGLAEAGYAVWWNLAFQFLRLYDFLYRRISHGATRLQEVLADRIAIQHYGLDAFQNGLNHVIRQSIVFNHQINTEIGAAVEGKRPLVNLYTLDEPADGEAGRDLEEYIRAALETETTEDDTHPSPRDRFKFGARISAHPTEGPSGPAWSLFADPQALMRQLTMEVAVRVTAGSGVDVQPHRD